MVKRLTDEVAIKYDRRTYRRYTRMHYAYNAHTCDWTLVVGPRLVDIHASKEVSSYPSMHNDYLLPSLLLFIIGISKNLSILYFIFIYNINGPI